MSEHVYGSLADKIENYEKALAIEKAKVEEYQSELALLRAMEPPSVDFLKELNRRLSFYSRTTNTGHSDIWIFVRAMYADAGLEMPKTEG